MNRLLFSVTLAAVCALTSSAQVRVDAPIILDGAATGDRQVQGLRNAAGTTEAVNAGSLRHAPYRYAEAGGNAWSITLVPTVATVEAGLVLLVKSLDDITGPLTLSVDGAGPFPVRKGNGAELGANDIGAGAMAHLVFDGSAFQLVSARRMDKRPCPTGSVQVTDQFCIEVNERDSVNFTEASIACGQANGRLCTWGEFYNACARATTLGIQNITGNYEWTNDAASGDGNVRVVGVVNCTAVGTAPAWNAAGRAFRCCYRR